MSMKVFKFGGSSVGSAEGLLNIKKIAEGSPSAIVVVSALGGVTDALIELADLAINKDGRYVERLGAIKQRHIDAIAQSVPEERQNATERLVEGLVAELSDLLLRVVSDHPQHLSNTESDPPQSQSSTDSNHTLPQSGAGSSDSQLQSIAESDPPQSQSSTDSNHTLPQSGAGSGDSQLQSIAESDPPQSQSSTDSNHTLPQSGAGSSDSQLQSIAESDPPQSQSSTDSNHTLPQSGAGSSDSQLQSGAESSPSQSQLSAGSSDSQLQSSTDSDYTPAQFAAAIISFGERLSSIIVSNIINGANHIDAREIIKTKPYFNRHVIDFAYTNRLIREKLQRKSGVVVLGGFISSDRESNKNTNLGRGGSDYTAAVVAAALDVDQLFIYTDVDGFMTADPRIVKQARLIDKLTFVEAMELCNSGAKVLYPPTIFPAYNRNIPISIRNTYNTDCEGTLISRNQQVGAPKNLSPKGLSSISNMALVTISGRNMDRLIGNNYRIFRSLAESGIHVYMASQNEEEGVISVGVSSVDAEPAIEILAGEFSTEISNGEIEKLDVIEGLAMVAIVGERLGRMPEITGRIYGTLWHHGIDIVACTKRGSETRISLMIKRDDLNTTLNVIHDKYLLHEEYKTINVFIAGTDRIGDGLIGQIVAERDVIKDRNALVINVIGICNSQRIISNPQGVELSNYKELLKSGREFNSIDDIVEEIHKPDLFGSIDEIVEEIRLMNLSNVVFVDCLEGANIDCVVLKNPRKIVFVNQIEGKNIADVYENLLANNISVISADNDIANFDGERYEELKNMAENKGVRLLVETDMGGENVNAIETVVNLRNSNDVIVSIQAAVSSAFNSVFNMVENGIAFSEAMLLARARGFVIDDWRVDLSGEDLVNKIVVLSREAGFSVKKEDVIIDPSFADIFSRVVNSEGSLSEFDAWFGEKYEVVLSRNRRWRAVATMNEGACRIEVIELDRHSPFYEIEGGNGVILIYSKRYREYPLQLKGFGMCENPKARSILKSLLLVAGAE